MATTTRKVTCKAFTIDTVNGKDIYTIRLVEDGLESVVMLAGDDTTIAATFQHGKTYTITEVK